VSAIICNVGESQEDHSVVQVWNSWRSLIARIALQTHLCITPIEKQHKPDLAWFCSPKRKSLSCIKTGSNYVQSYLINRSGFNPAWLNLHRCAERSDGRSCHDERQNTSNYPTHESGNGFGDGGISSFHFSPRKNLNDMAVFAAPVVSTGTR
jgi:hypothetical protein